MKSKRTVSITLWFVFLCYICAVVYLVFFSRSLGVTNPLNFQANIDYSYNVVPLKEIKRFISYLGDATYGQMAIMNLAGNILLFLPLGFLLPCIMRNMGFVGTMIASISCSCLIEVVQLFTKLGSFDVDDIILNVIGALIGFIIFIVVRPLK